MYINIDLEQTNKNLTTIKYEILLGKLLDAISHCYLGLGTPYDPFVIDNFVNIGGNSFSEITEQTKISISLKTTHDEKLDKIEDSKLVCCKVKNVGKIFNRNIDLPNYKWNKIFKYDKKFMYGTPDGVLYVSPDNGVCVVSNNLDSKKDTGKAYYDDISYSILISLKVKNGDEKGKWYYFILDPLVKISSNGGTNPPIIP